MAADFNKPVITDAYASVLQSIRDLAVDLAKCLDNTGTQNIPSGAIRWSATNSRFEKYNGSAWAALTSRMVQDVTSVLGYAPGNGNGELAVNNGSLNTNLNADMVDGYNTTDLLVRGAAAAVGYNYDTYVDNAFRILANAGDSEGLISYDIGGSLGKLQMNFNYVGLFRFRNKTDSTTWTSWRTVYHTGNFTPNATAQNNIGVPTMYGGINIIGDKNGWAGFQFNSSSRYFLSLSGQTGEYDYGSGSWQWRFDNGTLAYGTVPWSRISGVPSFQYYSNTGGSLTGYIAVANEGAVPNPYGAVSVTKPAVAETPAYFAMTRAGNGVLQMGLDSSNRLAIGTGTSGQAGRITNNWLLLNGTGAIWTSNYGWLHDYFARTVTAGYYLRGGGSGPNLTISHAPGFSGSGAPTSITVSGGHITAASFNCNCNCSC